MPMSKLFGKGVDSEGKEKLDKEDYPRVHKFYTEYLEAGYAKTKIARLYNTVYGTNHAESTLRNKYEEIERGVVTSMTADDIMKRETAADRKMAQAEARMREANNLNKYGKALIREHGDRTTVENIIASHINANYEPQKLIKHYGPIKEEESIKVFALADAHAGYKGENYNEEIFTQRMGRIFDEIGKEIKEKNLKEVYIFELGDQIEGTSLRKGQLAEVTTLMAGQVNLYTKVFLDNLRTLSDDFPGTEINLGIVTKDNHSEVRVHTTQRNELDDCMAKAIAASLEEIVQNAQYYGGMKNINLFYGDEIMYELPNGKKIFVAHGHNHSADYKTSAKQIFDDYGLVPEIIIFGHYHQHKSFTRNVINGFMGKTIGAPSIVGDTSFSDRLHLSSLAGILSIDVEEKIANEKFIVIE